MFHYSFHLSYFSCTALFSRCTFWCCNPFVLHFLHVAFLSCCTFSVLYTFLVLLFPCCTFSTLYSFHVALFPVLHYFHVVSFPVLHYFHIAFFVLRSFLVILPSVIRTGFLQKTSDQLPLFHILCKICNLENLLNDFFLRKTFIRKSSSKTPKLEENI